MKKRIEEELAGAYIRGQKVIDAFDEMGRKKAATVLFGRSRA